MGAAAALAGRLAPLSGPAALVGLAAILSTVGPMPVSVQAGILSLAVILSLPHGASDIVLADRLLRAQLGKSWLPVFVLAYAGAALAMLLVWQIWPVAALSLFLILSVFHFGGTDLAELRAPRPRLAWMIAVGSAPIVVPALAFPVQIQALFALLAGSGGVALAEVLRTQGAIAWGGAVLASLHWPGPKLDRLPLAAWLAGVTAVFILLPPLLAFAIYFGLLHNTRALRDLSRTIGMRWTALIRLSAWPSIAALAGLAAGWWLMQEHYGHSAAAIRTAFIGIAALTVPHMILALATAARWRENRALGGTVSRPHANRPPCRSS